MKLAICDDEEQVRNYLKRLFGGTGEAHEIAEFSNGESLLAGDALGYDAILLDIEMDGMSGIHAAEELRRRQERAQKDAWGGLPLLIFVTGHKEHMQEAFGVHAFAYLLKPFDDAEFLKLYRKMEDVCRRIRRKKERHLLIKTGGEVKRIPVDAVIYAESEKRKNILHLQGETVAYYGSMEELERELPDDFFRVHKGYLVNMNYVEKYDRSRIVLRGQNTVWISKYRYADFVEAYLKFIR